MSYSTGFSNGFPYGQTPQFPGVFSQPYSQYSQNYSQPWSFTSREGTAYPRGIPTMNTDFTSDYTPASILNGSGSGFFGMGMGMGMPQYSGSFGNQFIVGPYGNVPEGYSRSDLFDENGMPKENTYTYLNTDGLGVTLPKQPEIPQNSFFSGYGFGGYGGYGGSTNLPMVDRVFKAISEKGKDLASSLFPSLSRSQNPILNSTENGNGSGGITSIPITVSNIEEIFKKLNKTKDTGRYQSSKGGDKKQENWWNLKIPLNFTQPYEDLVDDITKYECFKDYLECSRIDIRESVLKSKEKLDKNYYTDKIKECDFDMYQISQILNSDMVDNELEKQQLWLRLMNINKRRESLQSESNLDSRNITNADKSWIKINEIEESLFKGTLSNDDAIKFTNEFGVASGENRNEEGGRTRSMWNHFISGDKKSDLKINEHLSRTIDIENFESEEEERIKEEKEEQEERERERLFRMRYGGYGNYGYGNNSPFNSTNDNPYNQYSNPFTSYI